MIRDTEPRRPAHPAKATSGHDSSAWRGRRSRGRTCRGVAGCRQRRHAHAGVGWMHAARGALLLQAGASRQPGALTLFQPRERGGVEERVAAGAEEHQGKVDKWDGGPAPGGAGQDATAPARMRGVAGAHRSGRAVAPGRRRGGMRRGAASAEGSRALARACKGMHAHLMRKLMQAAPDQKKTRPLAPREQASQTAGAVEELSRSGGGVRRCNAGLSAPPCCLTACSHQAVQSLTGIKGARLHGRRQLAPPASRAGGRGDGLPHRPAQRGAGCRRACMQPCQPTHPPAREVAPQAKHDDRDDARPLRLGGRPRAGGQGRQAISSSLQADRPSWLAASGARRASCLPAKTGLPHTARPPRPPGRGR